MTPLLDRLIEQFKKFPGIGPRQARRFVYYLLRQPPALAQGLALDLQLLGKEIAECALCHRYFPRREGTAICRLCADTTREAALLMILEKDEDLEVVEKSGVYHGHYFVLGGLIPLLDNKPAEAIKFTQLEARFKNQPEIKEVILALAATAEGDYTTGWLKRQLAAKLGGRDLKISILGRGLSSGSELEYADSDTLKNALANRG
jgi:recombination protein RecR